VKLALERNATVAFPTEALYDRIAPHQSMATRGEEAMGKFKLTVLAAAAVLTCLPLRPALAAGPLLAAPWAVGHLFRAAAALATLPLSIAAAAAPAAQAPAPYYAAPAYPVGPRGYYAPPAYYPPYGYPRYGGYYTAPAYSPSRAAYRAVTYPRMPMFQQAPRGYYAPAMRYSGFHGAQLFSPPRGSGYRHW
jgi:hypothetical protein